MKRRTFIGVLTGGLLGAPLAAGAQQPVKVVRIGYLSSLPASADSTHSEAFRQGLRDLGYVEGQNAVIEARDEEWGRAGIPLNAATWEQLLAVGEAMGLARVQAQAIAGPVAD